LATARVNLREMDLLFSTTISLTRVRLSSSALHNAETIFQRAKISVSHRLLKVYSGAAAEDEGKFGYAQSVNVVFFQPQDSSRRFSADKRNNATPRTPVP